MAITIGAIRNMLDMARGHAALERQDAHEQVLRNLMDRLSDTADAPPVKLPDDDTGRQVKFG